MSIHRSLLSLVILLGVFALQPQMSSAQGVPSQDQDQDQASEAAPRRTATATIANGLPVDGCSYPVTIRGVDYAPDAASQAAVEDLVPAGGTLTARVQYQLTGGTGRVECGFGTSRELPGISFRVLRVIE